MGHEGMGDMAEMGMRFPENSIPMLGAKGKHDYITMGGMFTVVKVREGLTSYKDRVCTRTPPGTLASGSSATELSKNGIDWGKRDHEERNGTS